MIKVKSHKRNGRIVRSHMRKPKNPKLDLLSNYKTIVSKTGINISNRAKLKTVAHPIGNNPSGRYTEQESKNILNEAVKKTGFSKTFDATFRSMRSRHKKVFGKDFTEK